MKKILLRKEYIYEGNLILINKKYNLKDKIKSYNLKPVNDEYANILLDYNCSLAFNNILQEINSKKEIILLDGYRSLKKQQKLWNNSLKENGEEFTKEYIAYPNCSEHQAGLAVDLGLNNENIDFIKPKFPHNGICQEFREKAIKYGFIQRYIKEKEHITKIADEEWHFRYVGYPHSEIIYKMGFCLEEYIEYLRNFKFGKDCLMFKNYEVSYIKMDENIKEIIIEDDELATISGDNINGIIITKFKKIKK